MKRQPFECPYDLESCGYVNTLTNTLDKTCKECERYNHGIRPSRGCYPSLRLATICIIGIIIMLILWNCQPTAMEAPSSDWKFNPTDSGMYFNEYKHGKLTRIFGPVPEVPKYKKSCDIHYTIVKGTIVSKEVGLIWPKEPMIGDRNVSYGLDKNGNFSKFEQSNPIVLGLHKADTTAKNIMFGYSHLQDTITGCPCGRVGRAYDTAPFSFNDGITSVGGYIRVYKYEKYDSTTIRFDTTIVSFGMRY